MPRRFRLLGSRRMLMLGITRKGLKIVLLFPGWRFTKHCRQWNAARKK